MYKHLLMEKFIHDICGTVIYLAMNIFTKCILTKQSLLFTYISYLVIPQYMKEQDKHTLKNIY